MPEIILHHYPLSPYSEKVRLALGLKRLAWASVIIPVWMPKPDLMPLTGGYRRTPVMQVGADVYCDTQCILRALEQLHPEPSLFPNGSEGLATALSWWWDRSTFNPAVSLVAGIHGDKFPQQLIEDRKSFLGREWSKPAMQADVPLFVQRLNAHLAWLTSMLADGRTFLLGSAPSAADVTAYHTLWFLRSNGGPEAAAMVPLDAIDAWYKRVTAIGHGTPREMSAQEALAIAAAAEPAATSLPADGDPSGLRAGSRVAVTPDDTGRDPVHGTLVAADAREIILRRSDPGVGEINVHFPRAGFDAVPAQK